MVRFLLVGRGKMLKQWKNSMPPLGTTTWLSI